MKKIGIIGTGVLGPQLAGLFAGCGVHTMLFGRRGKAASAKSYLRKVRPPALYTSSDLERVEAADIEKDIDRLGTCDWVIECIAESVEAKCNLLHAIGPRLNDDAVITSGTSGLTRHQLAASLDESVRRRFFITHFFYPPRYMKLVEIVTSEEVDEGVVDRVASFLGDRMGKGIVFAKDTPNFIANRIGVQYVMDAVHLAQERGWPIEAVDATMGRVTGRPATGIFGMADLVGIDTVAAVAGTVVSQLGHDPRSERCRIPQYMQRMVVNGWVGTKGGQGFYRRERGKVYAIDPSRLSYRPAVKFLPRSIADASGMRDVVERLNAIMWADDPGGEIAWTMLSNTLVYAAEIAGEIADDLNAIDRAMRWGYGWELGPFETWRALGVEAIAARLEREGRGVPALVRELSRERPRSIRGTDNDVVFRNAAGEVTASDDVAVLSLYCTKEQFDASCVDLIDGVLNRMELEWRAFVITGENDSFPCWMNLYDLLNKARLEKWRAVDAMLMSHQRLAQRMRYFRKPVVFAPQANLKGLAAELCLAVQRRHFWVENTLWIDHLMLGLIPAAGGCLSLLRMCGEGGPHPKVKRAFELIGSAARSISAIDAKEIKLAMECDSVTMDRERTLDEAIAVATALSEDYIPDQYVDLVLPGRGGEMALLNDIRTRMGTFPAGTRPRSYVQHDVLICKRLAHVLAGGDRATVHEASEQHVLDLEREAFLSLLGTPMTQQRIEHYLKTGKYLR